MKHSLLFLLLAALFMPWAAQAQSLFSEGFEGGSIPTGWTTDGPGTWRVGSGDYSSSTGSGDGTYNALITHGSTGSVTKLITPEINLSSVTSANLSFMHIQRSWSGDIDQLKVYYRTSTTGTWTQLVEYTAAVSSWTTEEDIILPNTSATYQLAFEYTDKYGYGVGLDNIRISPPAACARPTLGAAENISDEGVSFQWTENGSATQWELQYSTSADFANPTTITRNSIPSYAITGLDAATTYYVHVRSYCGDGLYSDWSNTVSFFTHCTAFNLPYTYGFENANDFECWELYGSTSTYTKINTVNDAPEGSHIFQFHYTERNAYLISPVFNGTSNGLSVTFQYMNYSATTSYTEQFQVGYTTNASETDPTAYTYSETIYGQNEWVTYENAFPANTKRIAIKYIYTDAMYLRLDDFLFDVPSNCRKPTDLVATEVGSRSATLSWTENGEATAWNLKVNDQLIQNVSNIPYTLTGLTPEISYTVQVSPVCEAEKWSNPITFTTLEACPKPANLTASDITPVSANISWTGEAERYEMEYAISPSFNFEDGTLQGWTNHIINADGGQWLHSNNNPGGYMDPDNTDNPYYPDLAHNGTGFVLCYSFIDNDGAYNTDAYLVSPRSYQIYDGASMNFWYDMANDNYPETFEVCVATAANPTANDFTAIWSSDANKSGNSQKAAVRQHNTRYHNWREVTINLSAYTGQTIWIAFHDVNEDMYEVWIDDITIDNGNIQWIPASAPIASPYTLEGLDSGTSYLVRVRANCGSEDGESAWANTGFTTPSNCAAPSALNVTDLMPTSATLNWTGYHDAYEVQYRKASAYSPIWEDGFEDGLRNWTIYSEGEVVTGETEGWYQYDPTNGLQFDAHGGSYVASAWSWTNNTSYNADNWLVSPELRLQGTLRFFVRTNNSFPDNYEVILSLEGNTIDDFTRSSAITLVELGPAPTGNQWVEVSIDMSDYERQSGYIAIHQNQYDGNYLLIDDFGLYEMTNPSEWTTVNVADNSTSISGLEPETTYEWQARGENHSCGDEGFTDWSEMGTFTTPSDCDPLTDLAIDELTATSITLSWTGYQESYNIQYRTAEVIKEYFYDWFDDGLSNWTDNNTSDYNSVYDVATDVSGYVFFVDEEVSGAQTLISIEMDPVASGTPMYFYSASEGNSTYKVGFSSTDNDLSSFTWSEELTTEGDGSFHPYEGEVPEGTKYFAIQFVSNDSEEGYFIITGFEIAAQIAEVGEWITLEGVNSPYTIDGLDPETTYELYVQGICSSGTTEWMGGEFTTPELTTVTQTVTLNAGSNWFSTYVEITLDDLKNAIADAVGTSVTASIKSQESSIRYSRGRWGNTPANFVWDVAMMYKIEVGVDCEIAFEGTPINPAEHPITITDGSNWIGYPFNNSMSLTNAFDGFAVNGDGIRSATLNNRYSRNRWSNNGLTTLEPGQGYIYTIEGGARTLIYPTNTKSGKSTTFNTFKIKKSLKERTNFKFVTRKK